MTCRAASALGALLLCSACERAPAPRNTATPRVVIQTVTMRVVRTEVVTAAPPREAAGVAPAAPAQLTGDVIALVDGEPVYVEEFTRVFNDNELEQLPGYVRREYDRNRAEFLEQLLANAVLSKAAAEEDFEDMPECRAAIDAAVDRIRTQYFYDRYIGSEVDVSDAEVTEYYERNQAAYTAPERVRVRHILLEVPESAFAAEVSNAWVKIHELRLRALQGAPFEELAAAESSCPSRARGGDLGYFERGQMVPAFEEVAFKLQKNEISSVVKTEFGYHIIQMLDRIPERRRSFEEVRDEIKDMLTQGREQAVYTELMGTLTNRYPVKRNEQVIRELVRSRL